MGTRAPAACTHGFTLIELVVVVTLVAFGAIVAMPSLADAMRIQRVRAATTDLASALLMARSEAIKRAAQVQVTPRSGADWATGWRVTGVTAGDQIDRKDALGDTLQVTRAPANVVYDRNGRLTVPGLVRIQISDGHATVRCVTIDPSGLPRLASGACP
jgi:type IV fimbrial biogenesis protein FimT